MKRFTLTELLVVIAIISVLAGFVLPVVSGSRQYVLNMRARKDINNIVAAIIKYEATYGKLPVILLTTGSNRGKIDPRYFEGLGGYVESASAGGNNNRGMGRLTSSGYDLLMQALSTQDIVSEDNSVTLYPNLSNPDNNDDMYPGARALNPKRIPFLDVPSDFASAGYLDPWGQRYRVVLDYELKTGDSDYYSDGTTSDERTRVAKLDGKIQHPALFLRNPNELHTEESRLLPTDGFTVEARSSDKHFLTVNNVVTQEPAILRGSALVYSFGPDMKDHGGISADVNRGCDDINSWETN